MRKAIREDKQLVIDILVSAFLPLEGENSINFVVKQDHHRKKRTAVLMGYLFERAFMFGEIFISSNNKACILFNYPNQIQPNFKTILLDVKLATQCIGLSRVFKILKRERLTNKHYPKENHLRPIIFGVIEAYKGTGTGGRLLLEVKRHFENLKLPVIIDAASEKNVKMYQKLGFKIIKKEESLGFPIYYLRVN